MRVLLFLVGLGLPVACALVACSSFSSSNEPGASLDAGTESGGSDVGDAAPRPPDEEAGLAACDAGAGTRACSDRYVFVSNETLRGDFAADGGAPAIDIAAAFCKADADRQTTRPDLRNRSWRAWLCTETVGAIGRVANADARWISPAGVVVFDDIETLRATTPSAALSTAAAVWTGCGVDGERSDQACGEWTTLQGSGAYGDSRQSGNPSWSRNATTLCANNFPIYCFEAAP